MQSRSIVVAVRVVGNGLWSWENTEARREVGEQWAKGLLFRLDFQPLPSEPFQKSTWILTTIFSTLLFCFLCREKKKGYRKSTILIPKYNRINRFYLVNMSQSHCFVSRKEIPVNCLFICPFPWIKMRYFLSPGWGGGGGRL